MLKNIRVLFEKNSVLKVLLILFLSTLIFFLVFNVIYKVYTKNSLTKPEITFFISSIKDAFQILFFFLAGIVTILSYLQARKSLFTPIRAETFKLQVKAFEEVLLFFQNKTEADFTSIFDMSFIIETNSSIMFFDFINTFYKDKVKLNFEKIGELRKSFVGGIVSKNWAHKNFQSFEYFEEKKNDKEPKISNPALQLEAWRNYEFGIINFTQKYEDSSQKLAILIASPIIPNGLKLKLQDFERRVIDNLALVESVLNGVAQELPSKFPNEETLKNFDPIGIWNRYNKEKEELEPLAKEILKYIRSYLKIDKLID